MTNDDESDPGGLAFTDDISIAWRPVEQVPDEARLAIVNESNESFLRAVSVIGAFPGEFSEEEMASSQEVARLDLKINLLLDLVSQLIYQQSNVPARRTVTISTSEISWRDDTPPALGDTVFMQVYIQHGTPKPLSVYGRVVAVQDDNPHSSNRVRYLGLSPSAQSWLDKLIFRHHRREVAFRRRAHLSE
ncbi:MAG: PilZ domain-containing protein [Halioglobus sp.]